MSPHGLHALGSRTGEHMRLERMQLEQPFFQPLPRRLNTLNGDLSWFARLLAGLRSFDHLADHHRAGLRGHSVKLVGIFASQGIESPPWRPRHFALTNWNCSWLAGFMNDTELI